MTSFFWAPMLEAKISTDYQVYEENAMASKESVADRALDIKQLFVSKTEEVFVFELGIHVIIMLCFSVMALKRLKDGLKKQYTFCLVSAFICILMSTKIWPWKWMPSILTMIQFPWRMLFMAGFFLSIVCSINMSIALKEFKKRDAFILSMICIIYTCALSNYIPYSSNIPEIEQCTLGIMSGKEVEVVAGTGKAEYLPKKAFADRFYIATRENAIYVLNGKAIVENEEKNGTSYTAKIQTIEQKTIFELPYIYYPGYQVSADGIVLETFETENGFLGFVLDSNEEISLEVEYVGTKIMKISLLISFIGIAIFLIYVWRKH